MQSEKSLEEFLDFFVKNALDYVSRKSQKS